MVFNKVEDMVRRVLVTVAVMVHQQQPLLRQQSSNTLEEDMGLLVPMLG